MTISRHPGSCAGPLPSYRWGRLATYLSLDAPADGFTRRPSRRPRPPFTRPWPPFLGRVCRAYSRPDAAWRLLQLHLRRAGNQTRALQDPRRDGDLDLLPFLRRTTPSTCAES